MYLFQREVTSSDRKWIQNVNDALCILQGTGSPQEASQYSALLNHNHSSSFQTTSQLAKKKKKINCDFLGSGTFCCVLQLH